jgi:hypothetical protein
LKSQSYSADWTLFTTGPDTELVSALADPRHAFSEVFDLPLGLPAVHRALQGNLAAVYGDLDFSGVDVSVPRQCFGELFLDALV